MLETSTSYREDTFILRRVIILPHNHKVTEAYLVPYNSESRRLFSYINMLLGYKIQINYKRDSRMSYQL